MPGGLSAFTNRPLMPAVWAFYKMLGRQGTFIQAAEIALRHFEETAPKDRDGFSKFLTAQATKCGLAIGLADFRHARNSAAKWYLVESYQVWDSFVKTLNDEYRRYKQIQKWKAQVGNATLTGFQQLLVNLPKINAQLVRAQPEFRLFEYYLAVRNWIVHPNKETDREAERSLELLVTEHAAYLKKRYPAVKAPNRPAALGFDDYMLFSRGMVIFAPIINDACDLRNEDIEHPLMIDRRVFLRNHSLKKPRIRNVARAYYTLFHGVNDALREEFADYVVHRFSDGHYSK